jgi:hypothetical protein
VRSPQVLQWLQLPEGRDFSDWLEWLRLRENKKLMENEELPLVFRAQGSVGILDVVLALEEDLKSYQRDLQSGKIKPFKEVGDAKLVQEKQGR